MKAGTGAGGQHVGGAAGAGGDKNGAGNNNSKAGGEDGGGSSGGGCGGGTDTGTDASAGNAATSHEPPNRQQANNGSGGETQHQQQQSQTAAAQKPPLPPTMTSAAKGGGGGGEQQQQTHQQHQDETKEKKLQVGSDSGDPDDPEEDEILEESPCKRWSKRREKVKQRDVPGIDAAYLAMDNETGNEVVWNEVLFSERKNFREQEEKIRAVFDHLTRLEHPYLVKFHKYWLDTKSEKPRIIFITEYMSSGPMSRFLQKARSSGTLLNIKAWKNWIRQILSALSYLHSCDPPIVHGNLTCNTMFIQHNGLVKIGCVAPNTIHHHVKTYRENIKNIHYLAPEYDHLTEITTQADIYSFGVCALEMATTGALQSGSLNGGSAGASTAGPSEKASSAPPAIDSGGSNSTATAQTPGPGGSHIVTEELLRKAVDSLEDPEQKEFINRCLEKDPNIRANAAELLSRLGPAEPEKDEISLDEEAFMDEIRQQTHEPTPTPGMAADRATSPPQQQETAPNIEAAGTTSSNTSTIHQHHQAPQQQQHNQAAAALLNQNTQQQLLPQTVTATQQDGYHTQCTVTTTIATHASAAATTTTTAIAHPQTSSTLLPSTAQQQNSQQQNSNQQQQQQMQLLHQTAPDEGYHTTQSIVDAPTGTSTPLSAEMSILPTSGMPAQHRETRQILQMQAEMLDSRQLRVQLQLDDQMNRQLTALLRDEDTPEALVAELVQHGFVSEANSPKMRELLATVLSEHRRRELEQAARREFGDSGQHRQSAAASSTASSNHSSAHQSPKHQSVPPPQTSSTS